MRRARNAGRAWDSHVWPTERALKEEIFDRYGIYTGYPMGIQLYLVTLYLVGFITLRLTSVIRPYTLQFPGYNPSYLLQTDS
ncbi:hypothetical protein ALC56_08678 [Trachymyrmex septentrionalis]|uniref:Uncharacterized protein n=1 Tax=Trachymyrmex septentrionalis TaxID=34720 RepID=A0A195F9J9_9HYME|nr:hypothetical protein ALC56_08678 [Trachymyrmex septentrionalis]